MNIIFFGTSFFSLTTLKALHASDHKILLVITQPDKKQGRKQKILPPAVKEFALETGIAIEQPASLKKAQDLKDKLIAINPDLFVVVSFGQILPQSFLDIPKFGTINIHASLLPKYRGASPIQAALAHGDTETGITLMRMDEKLDHGAILEQTKVPIETDDNFYTLSNKLADVGAKQLLDLLPKLEAGKIKTVEQNHTEATFTTLLKKEDGQIDWGNSAKTIRQQIAAYLEFPTSYTFFQGKRVIISEAEVFDMNETKKPGSLWTQQKSLLVSCGQGTLQIKMLQVEGKKPMTGQAFLNGYKIEGQSFTN